MATLTQIERQSVQSLPNAETGNAGALMWSSSQRGYLLPAWGTREREKVLRRFYRHEYNWLGQSAFAGLIKKVQATPWEIKGKRRVDYFADVLRRADFGRGWDALLSKVILDYLRQDGGGYIEMIAPGNPRRPPTGPVTGIAPLDSLACVPTGDPEFPVLYTNTDGTLHLLHHTRVFQLVDQPDGDQNIPGYGMCALSRAISIVARQILSGRYVEQKLDDKPPPGIVAATNLNESQRQQALANYMREQSADERPPWGKTMWMYGTDPEHPVGLEYTTFSQAPDSWSFVEYNNLDVNAWALALGVDVQELWQLSGGSLGSGQQSQILHAKSQGKTYGGLLTAIERALNQMLPDTLEFEFKRRDPFEAQERAQTAQLWASFVQAAGSTLSADEQRRLLANMVEAYADTVTDAAGQILRRDDLDTDAPAPDDGMQVAEDATPNAPDVPAAEPVAAQDVVGASPTREPQANVMPTSNQPVELQPAAAPNDGAGANREDVLKLLENGLITIGRSQELLGQPVDPQFADWYMVNGTPIPPDVYARLYETQFGRGVDIFSVAVDGGSTVPANQVKRAKELQATRLDFTRDWEDLLAGARDEAMNRRRFGLVARALVAKYARRAYEDGLKDGGVEDGMDDDDLRDVATYTAQQSAFVTDIGAVLFRGDGISDAQADQKPELWFNKSIYPAYERGRLSADKNGLYEWTLGRTEQHCETCLTLNGQRHRMKDYAKRQLLPRSSALACGGWLCDCKLTKSEGRARGRWPAAGTKGMTHDMHCHCTADSPIRAKMGV